MAKFFSAGLMIGAEGKLGSPFYYRPDEFKQRFLEQCERMISPNDDLYLIGDLIAGIQDLQFYDSLPECRLHVIQGTVEKAIPNFEDETYEYLVKHRNRLEVHSDSQFVKIDDEVWRIGYSAKELGGFSTRMPSICGDSKGAWRIRRLIDGSPIISVSVDAWGYQLVSEEDLCSLQVELERGLYDNAIEGPHFSDVYYRKQQEILAKLEQTTYGFLQTEVMQAYIRRWGWNFVRAGVLAVNDQCEFLCVEEPRMKDKITKQYIDVYDIWNLPSGSAKSPDENSKTVAVRRTKEETGYSVDLTGYLFTKEGSDENYPYVMQVYVAKVTGKPSDFDHGAIRSISWKSESEIRSLHAAGKLRSPSFMLEAIRLYTEGRILPLDVVATR